MWKERKNHTPAPAFGQTQDLGNAVGAEAVGNLRVREQGRSHENVGKLLRFAAVFAAVLLCLNSSGLRASANDAKVADEAGLLSYEEEEELQERLSEIAEEYQSDVVVATVNSCEGMDVQSFTDWYYYKNGYGYGENLDGIILLISMQERRFHLATRGSAIDTFTDYGLEVIDNEITPHLREGEYAKAFKKFADLAEEFLEEDAKGSPYDTNHTYKDSIKSLTYLFFAMGIGLFAAIITLVVLFQQLRSVRVKNEAREYVREGSFRITRANDIFLYRTVSRTRIQRDPPGGNSGGGGSMTHAAPGGGSAGGRSGSF